MEEIEVFVQDICSGNNYGYGSGYGDGDGYGYGSGDGDGDGDGDGYGYGSGDGDGYGDGDGSGYGYGDGDGSGYGYGSGRGDGYGYGYGLKSLSNNKVNYIDNIPTIINKVRGNIAKGFLLQEDFTLSECYIVKENNLFAHGYTLHDAYEALQEKILAQLPVGDRIARFKAHFTDFAKKYPAKELFIWHHILTGSCRFGREAFCRDKEIDISRDTFTIYEFVELTKNSYGGRIINLLLN